MIGAFHITTVRGVPIYLHFTVLLMLWIFRGFGLPAALLVSTLILLSVALHELGHTLVSIRYGNPVQDIILTPVGGVARLRGLPDDPHHEIRIALAGPYVSLALALGGYALVFLFIFLEWPVAFGLSAWFAGINTALLLFNMLPSFPMDGGRVLRGWLSQRKGPLEATRIASQLGRVMAVAFIVIGLIRPGNGGLAIIGLFIFLAAGSEYRAMVMKTWQRETFGSVEPGPMEADFEASPPPYAEKQTPKTPNGLLGDMWTTAVDLVREVRGVCRRAD